ncbi:MAG TPA: hypothetical protein DCZ49_06065 [Hyphomonadaceae bacterium]|nr:hypothetical protein [Hyphomonadaceae bacterium]
MRRRATARSGKQCDEPTRTRTGGGVIEVTAFKREYLTSGSKTALGLQLSPLEIPAAVSVISQDLLRDQQVNNVDNALRNVAGVSKFKTGNGGEERFAIRGFDASQSIYRDGARINNALNASNIPSTETANIERIEVLKGPSALLYGQGQPGGVINYVTKRPDVAPAYGLELIGGNFGFFKVEADATGTVPLTDKIAYRFVGAYLNTDSFRDEVARERFLINPSLLITPTDSTRLIVGYEFINDDFTQDRGQVLDGDNVQGFFFSDRQDVTQFFGIPNFNSNSEAEARRIYALGEYDVVEGYRIEATYSRTDTDKTNFDSSPRFITADLAVIGPIGSPVENLVRIDPRKTIGSGRTQQVTFKHFLDLKGPAGIQHQILASYTFEDFDTFSTSFRGDRDVFFNVATREYFTQFTLDDLLDPNILQPTDSVVFGLEDFGASLDQDFREHGVNFLDYIKVNNWLSLLFGVRYSDFRDRASAFRDTNIAFRGGLVVSPTSQSSIYFSFSEGYAPSGGLLGIDDGPIDPETSRSFELGGKLSLRGGALLLTTAIFDVKQRGVPFIVNPFDEFGNPTLFEDIRFGNIGEIRTRGGEIEAVGQITDNWRIQAGYAFLDNQNTETGLGLFEVVFSEGARLPGIAAHNFNLFTFYEIETPFGELGIGGGVFAQTDVFISTENRAEFNGFIQADLAAYFKRGRWKVQINARNVTDAVFLLGQNGIDTDSFAAIRTGTSAPRTITGSIAVAF